jgi:PAS domain S-box-containing protein
MRAAFDLVEDTVIIAEVGTPEPIVYVNPAFERASGHAAAEAIGRTIADLLSLRPVGP